MSDGLVNGAFDAPMDGELIGINSNLVSGSGTNGDINFSSHQSNLSILYSLFVILICLIVQ